MQFSKDSEITLVVTSCGRFDLLERTLHSFDRFNSAPIREVLITEDSGDEAVRSCVPAHWLAHTRFFVNVPKLGQLASIDLAYSCVATPYIFHCEDDWEFYRPGFVEDSLAILMADPEVLQVWLRSYAHDLRIHSPYLRPGERRLVNGVSCYPVISDKPDWQGFSLNPGLRRLVDYRRCAPFAAWGGEKALSKNYAELGLHAVMLEGDAVLHTGFDAHVTLPVERLRKQRRKKREQLRIGAAVACGVVTGAVLGHLLLL